MIYEIAALRSQCCSLWFRDEKNPREGGDDCLIVFSGLEPYLLLTS